MPLAGPRKFSRAEAHHFFDGNLSFFFVQPNPLNWVAFDEGQITHLICAHLKYDLYDFFRGVLGPASCSFLLEKAPKHPLKESYRSYFRRAQIR